MRQLPLSQTLIILSGLPGCDKTTLADNFATAKTLIANPQIHLTGWE